MSSFTGPVRPLDGPAGASFGGGIVTGATTTLASPTTGDAVTLTITGAQPSDSGDYTAMFSNTCGEVETLAAFSGQRLDALLLGDETERVEVRRVQRAGRLGQGETGGHEQAQAALHLLRVHETGEA